jgi:hypothetical protein
VTETLIRRSEGLARLLREELAFSRLLLAIAGLIGILKGLRLPYSWAATQAQLDYRHGFIRRGFFGEVCRQLRIPISHYPVFATLSFFLLGAALLLLAYSLRRSRVDEAGFGAFSALVASGFFLTYLVNIVGYYDVVMLLLVLLVFQVRDPRLQLVTAAVLALIGVLIHELYVIDFLPVSLVGSVCWAAEGDRRWRKRLCIGSAVLAPCLMVLTITRLPLITPAEALRLGDEIQSRVDFATYRAVYYVLDTSSSANVRYVTGLMHAGAWWVIEAFGLLAFLPTTLFFLALAWRWGRVYGRRTQWYLVLSTFSPMALNIIAFDRYRWLTMLALNAVLCSIAIAWKRSRDGYPVETMSIAWRRGAVLLLALNLATDVGFFMGHVQGFPFQGHWEAVRRGTTDPELSIPR